MVICLKRQKCEFGYGGSLFCGPLIACMDINKYRWLGDSIQSMLALTCRHHQTGNCQIKSELLQISCW